MLGWIQCLRRFSGTISGYVTDFEFEVPSGKDVDIFWIFFFNKSGIYSTESSKK